MDNPFSEGENRIIRPPSTAIVIFGATGDLTVRKLVPALANLAHDGYLPTGFVVVGAARSALSDDEFRERLWEGVKAHSRRVISEENWKAFASRVFYQKVAFPELQDYQALKARLTDLAKSAGESFNHLYYLATSPEYFGTIATQLGASGLVEDPTKSARRTSIVVEKPFGHDRESAAELNKVIRASFAESQIFRIDHYLGKETVQNILVFRFANGIFEPLWNHKYVDHIQISVCEEIGVGSRAGYFDSAGILRDVVQNHLLQMLALLCIEPPISLGSPESIRDEKVKVLRSLRPLTEEHARSRVVRGRYSPGFINGKAVPGYLNEKGVSATSTADTFVALAMEIDNWRWSGVPIYVRAGKRLPRRITEITIYFRSAPDSLFRGRESCALEQNVLAIQVQPKEGISLKISSKPPGPRMRVRPVVMDFTYQGSFGVPSPDAYERLLLDAMRGDPTLFTRDDEIDAAWEYLNPILSAWSADKNDIPVHEYEAGTWGPKAAANLLRPRGHRWRRL